MKSTSPIGCACSLVLFLAGTAHGQANDVVCTQCVGTSDIADFSITTEKLKASSVTSQKIADGAVATADIADFSITTEKLKASSVTSQKIADGAVATADIADFSITTAKLKANSITEGKLEPALRDKLTAPQVLFAGSFADETTNLTVAGGCTHYAEGEVTITVPGPGKIKVDAQAWLRLTGHTSGTHDRMNVYLSNDDDSCESSDGPGGYFTMAWVIASGEATWNTGQSERVVPVSRTFTVGAAGTYTYFLNGLRTEGNASGGFWFAALQAVYFPDLSATQ